ncbi:aldehyde dehydrogenase family protein [Pseudanabaena galeata UHCC 0370]|jgi:glutamate-5-semialdehyde dehydrogenase|uniref:Gamma-glutamyl phosphate reductase n=1 Tax=Pseudanabaena galeata UHCC 0370 TaxID=3110310 RepID=A0ABU5TM18_9CYAN|nr:MULTISPECIES: aldehyde dehydrogenase family protein [Pseudanabaena]MEA5479076.1 aldehyde dehydrogenase family protein [Pseudanabaena galeata UHCC 0370]MEA5489009.1 aldehyde dehydrogenase family protein [Pseudanabaena sp. CCNP1317]WGS72921.1 aldehyde dehydrogenase family protein [Pseudanabaena galeata CCNP1313]
MSPEDLTGFIYKSHAAALQLMQISTRDRDGLLIEIANSIKKHKNAILEANTLDLEASRDMAVPELVLEWLKLTPERLNNAIECLTQLANLPDPLTLHVGINGYQRVPLGVVAFIYEGFPQLGLIAAGMCLKVGNTIILKGGSEGTNTQEAIAAIVKEILVARNFPEACMSCVPKGVTLKELIVQEKYLRLVIPYGRPSFVQQVSKQATVSALPVSMGNCYLYLAASGKLDFAKEIILNSRKGDPDAVNAIEKVIVHRSWLDRSLMDRSLGEWISLLRKQGLVVRGCAETTAYFRQFLEESHSEETDKPSKILIDQSIESEDIWGHAYLDETIAIKIVNDTEEAIAWINQYSSGHADVLLTDSLSERDHFVSRVNSSTIFVNAHSRFSRCSKPNDSGNAKIALGMSSLKTRGASRYPGVIDIYALTTTKQVLTNSWIP